MEKNIFFIRHGITEGIEKKLFYGWIDFPVSENGFKELKEFREKDIYPRIPLDKVEYFTSGLTRANQTLNAIYDEVPYKVISQLKEINFGDWEGKSSLDLSLLKEWDMWMKDTTGNFRFPNGESANDFLTRLLEGIDILLKELDSVGKNNGILVFHGGAAAALMQNWFKEEGKYFNEWTPNPGRGFAIKFVDDKPVSYEVI